jgi:hypothetical protein
MAKEKQTETKALRQKLKDLESEILDLKNQSSAINADDIESLKEIELIEKKRTKNLKQYYELKKKISELNNKNNKTQTDEEKRQEDHLKNVEKSEKEINDLRTKSSIIMRSFNEDTQTAAKVLGIASQETERLSGQMKILKELTSESAEQNNVLNQSMKAAVQNANSLDSISLKIAEGMENINQKGYELIDTYQIERSLKEQSARLDLSAKELGTKRYVILKSENQEQMKKLEGLKKVNVALDQQAKKSKEVKDNSTKTRGAMIGILAAVPGGGFLMNRLGLGDVLNKSKTIGQTMRGWGASLAGMAIAAPFAALLGIFNLIVAAFKFILGSAFELDKRIANLSKNLFISRSEATGLERKFANMALRMNIVGINTEEFGKSLEFLTEEYGASVGRIIKANESSKFVDNITILREKLTLTNEEALNFGKISSIMGVSMGNLAYQSIKITKAFLNNRQIIKAMANVPQLMANGMKGAVSELVKFVAKAKMMGIDLKGFADALEGTLDIESSLEKQFTAETITGIHFKNMDAIRLATNSMQYDKAFDMLMSNVGNIKNLADMPGGLIGIRSIADLFGFSVEDFTKMFNKFQELKNAFGGQNPMQEASRYMAMSASQIRKEIASMGAGARKNYLENLAAEKEGSDITTEFMDKMNKIKLELMDSTLPIIDEIHAIFKELITNRELKDLFSDMTKRLPSIIKSLIEMGRQLKEIVKSVFGFLKQFGIVSDPLNKTKTAIAGVNEGFLNWNKVIGTTVALFMGYKGLGWAVNSFKSNVLGLGPVTQKTMKSMVDELKMGNQQMMQQMQTMGQYGPPSPGETSKKGKGRFGGKMAPGIPLAAMAAGFGLDMLSQNMQAEGNTQGAGLVNVASMAATGAGMGAMLGPWGMLGGAIIGGGLGYFMNSDQINSPKLLNNKNMPKANQQNTAQITATAKELEKFSTSKIESASKIIAQFAKSFYELNRNFSGFINAGLNEKLQEVITIFNSADNMKMQSFATGVLNFSNAISELNKNLTKLDIQKLEKAAEKINPGAGGFISSVSSFANSVFSGVQSVFGNNQQQVASVSNATVTTSQGTSQVSVNVNTAALEQKIDRLITVITNISTQPTYIKIGERTVEAIAGEMNWKKQMKIGSDNTYGSAVRDTL